MVDPDPGYRPKRAFVEPAAAEHQPTDEPTAAEATGATASDTPRESIALPARRPPGWAGGSWPWRQDCSAPSRAGCWSPG